MEDKGRELTPREQAYFEDVRQAKAQGVSLKAHCEARGIDVRSLYGVKRDLVKKGILPRTRAPKLKTARPSPFVAVQVAGKVSNGAEPVCRVRHPSGLTIECSCWPEAGWVSALLQGVADAAA